jgi:hypothetical protein
MGFLRGSKIDYEPFGQEFSVKMTHFTSRVRDFLAPNLFLLIFGAIDASRDTSKGGLFFFNRKQHGLSCENGEQTLP